MKVFVMKCQASVTLYNRQFLRGKSPKCVSQNKNVYRADTFVKHSCIYVWNIIVRFSASPVVFILQNSTRH